MKRPLFSCALLAFLTLPAFALSAANAPAVPAPKAALKVDPSPVSEGAGGRVTSYADVIEPAEKAVVSIHSTKTVREHMQVNPMLRQFFGDVPGQEKEGKETGLGSGVIVSPNGYILTNNHVVEGFETFKVSLKDGREFTAKVVGADPKTDVAVVKIEATALPVVTLADSEKLRDGDIVFAVGNPLEVGETVTMGIVSAKGRNKLGLLDEVGGYENFIQTDAAINLGNSGGALLDAKGRLVGINSAIISPTRGNIGIGFAIPVNLAASVMRSLIETGTVKRGFLGVSTTDVNPDVAEQVGLPKDAGGTIVINVSPDSPAAKAGLQRSDVILAVNGKPVSTIEDLHFMIGQMLPGAKVDLKIFRDGKARTISLTLGSLVDDLNELLKGVDAAPLAGDLRRKLEIEAGVDGLAITNVAKDSPYAERLEKDMVIVEIDRHPVADLATAQRLLHPGRHLLFVYDHGSQAFVAIVVREQDRP